MDAPRGTGTVARFGIGLVCVCLWTSTASAQAPRAQWPDRTGPPRVAEATTLPTDRWLRESEPSRDLSGGRPAESFGVEPILPPGGKGGPPLDIRRLMRPRVSLSADWEGAASDVAIGSTDVSIRVPTYPFFGPPPPFLTAAYSLTVIDAPDTLDLPETLHEFSLGASWMRPINERWMARLMVSTALATDLHNAGGDAWQIRGGGFALFRPNERWSFALGALATGRRDLPVIPAIGAVWQPQRRVRVNLMLPNPQLAFLWTEDQLREHWVYLGAAISGGAWAYRRQSGLDERLNYRGFRFLVGWECRSPTPPGSFISLGPQLNVEAGYVLGRKFEFDEQGPDLSLDGTWVVRAAFRF